MNFSILASVSNSISYIETAQMLALLGVTISSDQIPPPLVAYYRVITG